LTGSRPDVAQHLRADRVQDVEGRDVDDDPAGLAPTDLLDQVLLEADQLGVIEDRVDRGDEVGALTHDRDQCRCVSMTSPILLRVIKENALDGDEAVEGVRERSR
jgi:hypothetical protein